MSSFISPSQQILSKKLVLKGLIRFNPTRSLLIFLSQTSALHFIGRVFPSSMMNLRRFLGLMMPSNAVFTQGLCYQASCVSYRTASCGSYSFNSKDSSHSPSYGRHHKQCGLTVLCLPQYWRQFIQGMAACKNCFQQLDVVVSILYA